MAAKLFITVHTRIADMEHCTQSQNITRFEGSAITYAKGYYWAIFDSLRAIARINLGQATASWDSDRHLHVMLGSNDGPLLPFVHRQMGSAEDLQPAGMHEQ
eukprot:1149754-Pelagomonas_calceolata.AAC.7